MPVREALEEELVLARERGPVQALEEEPARERGPVQALVPARERGPVQELEPARGAVQELEEGSA